MSALGTLLLVAALGLSLLATALWAGAARFAREEPSHHGERRPDDRFARWTTFLTFGAVAVAAGVLEGALLRHDTALAYVARVVEPGMPVYYRITSLWSAMEGSLLLWLLCVAAVAAGFVAVRSAPPPAFAAAAAVLCAVVAAFAVVVLVASPFAPAEGPAGPRPSPLLQDHPAMAVHPPLLYAGFALLAVPYALSVGALLTRTVDRSWVRALRGWTQAAWIPLTAGVLLGAWWSYAVLGWGGYWAWDPVENASLMPWLLATALLHAPVRSARAGLWRTAPAALAGTPFLFVLLAVFLTRSGVVQSIHAFSTSPLGPLLLGILAAAALPWAVLAGRRRRNAQSSEPAPLLSRHAALGAGRLLLVLITAFVLVGSVLPSAVLALTGDRLSVGTPWYARTLTPLAVALLGLMALGPLLSWRREKPRALAGRLRVPAVAAAAGAGATGLLAPDLALALAAGLAAFVAAALVQRLAGRRNRRTAGALLAHLGVALGAVAVVGSGHAVVTEQTVSTGATVTAGTTTATLLDIERRDEGNRTVAAARLVLTHDGDSLGPVQPELRWYEEHGAMLTGPDIRTGLLRDVYVTLLDVDPVESTATVRLAVNPLIGWLWAAGALTVAGAGLSAWPRGWAGPSFPPREGAASTAAREPVP